MSTFHVSKSQFDDFMVSEDTDPGVPLLVIEDQLNCSRTLAGFEATLAHRSRQLEAEAERVERHWTERLLKELGEEPQHQERNEEENHA